VVAPVTTTAGVEFTRKMTPTSIAAGMTTTDPVDE
jgi:hypothetical protein